MKINYIKRMKEILKLTLEKKPITDPVKLFTIPDSEKPSHLPPPNGAETMHTVVH